MDQWRRQARIIHLALVAGVVLTLAVLAVIRRAGGGVILEGAVAQTLGIAAVCLAVAATAAVGVVSRRLERRAGEDDAAWGRRAFATGIVVWAMAEGAAVMAGVVWFLTGKAWVLAVAAGGLALLVLNGPDRRVP